MPKAGAALFFGKAGCAQCHMVWGRGSLNGPDLTEAARKLTLAQMETALLKPAAGSGGYQVANIKTAKGESLRGFIRNESSADLQMQSFDGRLHLLSKNDVARIDREPRSIMPAWTGSRDDMRDLIKFLQAAPRCAQAVAPNPKPCPAASPGMRLSNPKRAIGRPIMAS